ncbi:RNA methyltransferase [Bacillota bacterium]
MKLITSSENPILKRAIGLKQRKARERDGLYLVEGLHVCKEALSVPEDIEMILIRESLYNNSGDDENLREITESINDGRARGILLSDRLFDKFSETDTPQGIAALIKRRKWDNKAFIKGVNDSGGSNLLILDRVQDPGNAGTLIRTAEAAGFYGIIAVKGTVDLYGPKAVRSAAGSILRQKVLFTDNAEDTVDLIHSFGKKLAVASPYSDSWHFRQALDRNVALVIGNEAGGASPDFLAKADLLVKIPMANTVESLNAAVAGGILMYESVRQNFQNQGKE